MYENYPFQVPESIRQKIQVESEPLHRVYASHWSESNNGGEPLGLSALHDWGVQVEVQVTAMQEICDGLGVRHNGLMATVGALSRLMRDFEPLCKLAVETLPFDPVVRAKVLETQPPADGESMVTEEVAVQ